MGLGHDFKAQECCTDSDQSRFDRCTTDSAMHRGRVLGILHVFLSKKISRFVSDVLVLRYISDTFSSSVHAVSLPYACNCLLTRSLLIDVTHPCCTAEWQQTDISLHSSFTCLKDRFFTQRVRQRARRPHFLCKSIVTVSSSLDMLVCAYLNTSARNRS